MASTFKVSVEINLPIDKLFELFLEKKYYKEWKKDFISYEPVSGTPGETGAVTKLIYKRQTMFETITDKNPPSEIIANYEHKMGEKTNMFHKATNRFTALSASKTLIEVEMEIIKVVGLFMRLMMALMSGAGKKHAQIQLNQLKAFAEKLN